MERFRYQARPGHPEWCERDVCDGGEHVSRIYRIPGDVPLVVELFQDAREPTAHLSILESDSLGMVVISPEQSSALAVVLAQLKV